MELKKQTLERHLVRRRDCIGSVGAFYDVLCEGANITGMQCLYRTLI